MWRFRKKSKQVVEAEQCPVLTEEQIRQFRGAANDQYAFARGIEGLRACSPEDMAKLYDVGRQAR